MGYAANISLNTYSAIQGKKTCKLYVYEAIREDAYVLYGFADKQERDIFLLLISVSGIGGNTARMILSAFSPAELVNVISTENANLLKTVKGIGLKTAQRVIVDLKDKVKTMGMASADGAGGLEGALLPAANAEVQEEAIAALTMLGFAAAPSQKVVLALLKEEPDAPVEKVIKLALKRL
ncbi:Holliday junction DNA helicase RuvA [gut metagenome]|uniref:Holliday junction DNA helicase RuvA n=1 Tax=gut metagenome TaxID=749906 RepID=J9GGX9_9ZZZZ